MAGTKKVSLNQNKQLKLLLIGVLLLLFAGVASYLINSSSAATNNDVVGVYSAQNVGVSGVGVTNVNDYMGQVTQVPPGSTLNYLGKGGGSFVQTKNCYIMRAVDGSSEVILRGAKGAKKMIIPKSDYFHEYCVSDGRLALDGVVKVVSGSKVNVFQMEYFYYFTQ